METNINTFLIFLIALKEEEKAIGLFKEYANKTSLEGKSYINKLELLAKDEIQQAKEGIKQIPFTERMLLKKELGSIIDDEFIKKGIYGDSRLAWVAYSFLNYKSLEDSEKHILNLTGIDKDTFNIQKNIIKIDESLLKESISDIRRRTKIDNEKTKEHRGNFQACLVFAVLSIVAYFYTTNQISDGRFFLYSEENRKTINTVLEWLPLVTIACGIGAVYFYNKMKEES